LTVRLPVLLLLEVITSQDALLETVQVHVDWAVTATVPVPPDEPKDWEVEERE